MPRLLVVDDDEAMRNMIRFRLSGACEVIDTGDPGQAMALALEHKPDAVLVDLMMPKFSGLELVQNFRSLSHTARVPIFVITGESAAKYKPVCEQLGATAFFEKPLDFAALKAALASELESGRPERRAHVRVRMRMLLSLRGRDANGSAFETVVTTDNVSAGGFACACPTALVKDAIVEVFLATGGERHAGRARVVRKEQSSPWPRYGFQFVERGPDWIMQG